jgi:hypothetical protein
MAIIHCHVWWGDTVGEHFELDSTKRVDDLIEMVRLHAGSQLSDTDPDGHPIHYILYKIEDGQREKISGHRSLANAKINDDVQLHLVDQKAPWQQEQITGRLGPRPSRERQVGDTPPSTSKPQSQTPTAIQQACRLQVVDGGMVDVSHEGIVLDRGYLLKHLPTLIVAREQLKILFGIESRLGGVSRQPHCEIIHQQQQWFLRAFKPTYINGRMYEGKATVMLTRSTILMLGRDGWQVEVLLT